MSSLTPLDVNEENKDYSGGVSHALASTPLSVTAQTHRPTVLCHVLVTKPLRSQTESVLTVEDS